MSLTAKQCNEAARIVARTYKRRLDLDESIALRDALRPYTLDSVRVAAARMRAERQPWISIELLTSYCAEEYLRRRAQSDLFAGPIDEQDRAIGLIGVAQVRAVLDRTG